MSPYLTIGFYDYNIGSSEDTHTFDDNNLMSCGVISISTDRMLEGEETVLLFLEIVEDENIEFDPSNATVIIRDG